MLCAFFSHRPRCSRRTAWPRQLGLVGGLVLPRGGRIVGVGQKERAANFVGPSLYVQHLPQVLEQPDPVLPIVPGATIINSHAFCLQVLHGFPWLPSTTAAGIARPNVSFRQPLHLGSMGSTDAYEQ